MRKNDLKIPTEVLIYTVWEKAIRINYVKYHIDKSVDSPSCEMCGETSKTINHNVIEYSKLAQRECKRRHDNVARMAHSNLRKIFNFEDSEKWYLHNPQTVTENLNLGQIWDVNIQFDNVTMERRPDIVTDNKMDKTAIIIDVAVPGERE